jgi:lipopolysaccharide/colanic/teichoic acid biosynthesis glycosyltransferase
VSQERSIAAEDGRAGATGDGPEGSGRRTGPRPHSHTDEKATRIFDLLSATLALVIFSPVLALIGVLIKLESPGPVFFKQKRVGKHEKPFEVYKFRSMTVAEAEEQRVDSTIADIESFQFVPRGRKTAIGRAIRACSLDEMANLLNVIKGEMHIIGPRPDEAEIVAQYRPEWRRRHDVAPGITGLAQIHGRADLTYAETMAYDLQYVDTRSFKNDIRILLSTFGVVARREGAR